MGQCGAFLQFLVDMVHSGRGGGVLDHLPPSPEPPPPLPPPLKQRPGGGLEKWGSVSGPLFCVRTDVGAEGAGTQNFGPKKFFPPIISPPTSE